MRFFMDWQQRERTLIGDGGLEKLRAARVAVVGLGGVGGAAAEALARAGIGSLVLVDFDRVDITNKNRQLLALDSTVGELKTAVCAKRISDINPDCRVTELPIRVDGSNVFEIFETEPCCVIDAVDSVTAKLLLIEKGAENGVFVVSCCGTGNRLDADFAIGQIEDTAKSGCPLARVMRRELKKRGLSATVLYSKAPPITSGEVIGSVSWVPPAAGLLLAGCVIKRILNM